MWREENIRSHKLPDDVNGDGLRTTRTCPVIVIRRVLEPRNCTSFGPLALCVGVRVSDGKVGVTGSVNPRVGVLQRKRDVEGVPSALDLEVGNSRGSKLIRLGRLCRCLTFAILSLEETQCAGRIVRDVPDGTGEGESEEEEEREDVHFVLDRSRRWKNLKESKLNPKYGEEERVFVVTTGWNIGVTMAEE